MEKLIAEAQALMDDEIREANSKLHSGGRKPQSYEDDMNGFVRGLSIMGNKILLLMKEQAEKSEK